MGSFVARGIVADNGHRDFRPYLFRPQARFQLHAVDIPARLTDDLFARPPNLFFVNFTVLAMTSILREQLPCDLDILLDFAFTHHPDSCSLNPRLKDEADRPFG